MSSSVESVVSRSGEKPSSEISEMGSFETARFSSGVLSSFFLFRERSNWADFLFLEMVCGCGEFSIVGSCSLCSGSLGANHWGTGKELLGTGSKRLSPCCKRCISFVHNDVILICEQFYILII